MIRKWLPQIKWFILFLARAFAPTMNDLYPVFQFTATNFISMAAKSSDLVDKTSGANLQADGQAGSTNPRCEGPIGARGRR